MSFRRQLIAGHAIALLLTIGTAVTAIVALQVASSAGERVARQLAYDLSVEQRLRYAAERLVTTSRGYLLTGEAEYETHFEDSLDDLRSQLRALTSRPLDVITIQRAGEVERTAKEYVDAAETAARERIATGDPRKIIRYFDETMRPKREAFEGAVDELANHEAIVLEAWLDDAQGIAQRAQLALALASGFAIASSIALALIVMRRLSAQYERMRKATEAATQAAAARQEVLAVVSHDLRNPLGAIQMASSLLADADHDDRSTRQIAAIRTAADRMQHMIDELLEAARAESRTLELHREICDTKELLARTSELFEGRANKASIRLRIDAAPARVFADRERVLEVLSNLVGNALKFTPPGGEIRVTAEPRADEVLFKVEDNGPGIEPEQLPHVFERHWQGRRQRGSLGLGLYISKHLVEAQGGHIGADSVLGEGTTMWFTLPMTAPRL
jgi:signal transduction histidine kinase